eukprot:TRINITY_DN237_c1_g1_i1.p1 TRINITY_DN237_c1_g1~~TRINITY_DN237_c1_g1_i1.p1  ORF type:complete len:1431 (+),score=551.25 TRINITY_DN237_c1_g1_i1:149-4441(+)
MEGDKGQGADFANANLYSKGQPKESDPSKDNNEEEREENGRKSSPHHRISTEEEKEEEEEREEEDQTEVQKEAEEGGPTIELDGKKMKLTEYLKKHSSRYHVCERGQYLEVRNLSYKITTKQSQGIPTIRDFIHPQKKEKKELQVLDNISFILKPGEMTAILGSPRSGKTSLFDILASRRQFGEITGAVTLNGKPQDNRWHRNVSYCVQGDLHYPRLTVKETFEFAAWSQMPELTPEEKKHERVDLALQLLGLKHAADTIVGNETLRGVSGGEKRRVTIGVEWVKNPNFFLLDEPTTGLDSSSSLDVGKCLKVLTGLGTPVLCALLQPSWELLSLFDTLILLSGGQIAYQGPVTEAEEYFKGLGYNCPPTYSLAEFFSEVVDHPEKFQGQEGCQDPKIQDREGFVKNWRESEMAKQRQKEMDEHFAMLKESNDGNEGNGTVQIEQGQPRGEGTSEVEMVTAKKMKKKLEDESLEADEKSAGSPQRKYPTTLWTQLKLNIWRGGINFRRDRIRHITVILNEIFIALILGALFFRKATSQSDATQLSGLLFFTIAHLTFSSISNIPNLFGEREIYYRQRGAKYYSVLPFYISNIIWSLPATVAETLIFGSIVYWMAGLNPEHGTRFLFFLLVLVTTSLLCASLSRACGAILPNAVIGSLIGSSMIAIYILFSGFLVPKQKIPDPWIWAYWISFVHYAIEALSINNFAGLPLFCLNNELVPPIGDPQLNVPVALGGFGGAQTCPLSNGGAYIASSYSFHTQLSLRWAFWAGLFGYYLMFTFITYLGFRFCNYSKKGGGGLGGMKEMPKFEEKDDKDKEKAVKKGALMVFKNICYTVPVKGKEKTLLNNIDGYVKPGMLLALMGASGAGKSTLLDVLAQRKNVGKITGDILVNGKNPDKFYHRLIGYVEQTDCHYPYTTVREAIDVSARCRLAPEITKEQREEIVDTVVDLLGLRPIAGALVGLGGGQGGINLEERKRLSIAVELASNPRVLFLDEPTSGLDSNGADKVMESIKKIADAGCSVICTIHQPSQRIFSRATHLLLLKKGGHMVYFGPLGDKFKDLKGYFKEKLDVKCPKRKNPADFVIEQAGAGIGRGNSEGEKDISKIWNDSENNKQLKSDVDKLKSEQKKEDIETFTKVYPLPLYKQFLILTWRFWMSYWRNPFQLVVVIARALFLAFIFGTVYFRLNYDSYGGQLRVALMFVTAIYANLTAFAYFPVNFANRPVFYRERDSGMYRTTAWQLAQTVTDFPIIAFGTILFATPLYWITGLDADAAKFFYFLFTVLALNFCALSIGQLFGVIFPSIEAAGLIFGTIFAIFALSAGFLLPRPGFPVYGIWIYWMSFLRYAVEGLAVNELRGLQFNCNENGGIPVVVTGPDGVQFTRYYCQFRTGEQVIQQFGMINMIWADVFVLWGMYLLATLLSLIGLRFIRHAKR